MKTLVAFVAALVSVSGYLINVPVASISEPSLAPAGWVHLQNMMMPLFENVCETSGDPTVVRLSQEFLTTTSSAEFWDAECFTKLKALKASNNLLVKGQIFTEYNPEHIAEVRIIFEVLKNAKTFDTFYKAASWARQNLNCGLYVDAIYSALMNRRDTDKLTLPPPYELLPNYFIRKDIIIQGSSLLAGQDIAPSAGVRDEGNAYTLDANYTSNIYDSDDELKLAYYREDVGLNSFYFLNMLKCGPWRKVDVDINSGFGDELYYWMKQWSSRYNLERYSNGLPELDGMNWDLISNIPYDPMLVYSNGNEFIHRTSPLTVEENEDKALLQTIENNLATVVSHMRDGGYNKTQILNHLMEILVTGEKSYETLARRLLGKALSNNGSPSVLEHYMTSLRDPMFWKLNKKIVDLIDNSLKVLSPYAKNELYFPGVEVVNVEVKKLMTSFDYFEFDITDALKIGNGDTTFQVKIGQPRLNHKSFPIKINISSLVTQKGMVKIYLGPKVMPGEFSNNKNLFSLLDCFDINLKRGSNIVTRNSEDITRFSPDLMSLKTLRKKVEDAQYGLNSLSFNSMNSQIRFPSRLVLPKGTPEGLPLQLLVFVAPYMKTTVNSMYSVTNLEFNEAIKSKLYPLDLPIDDNMLLSLPNLMFKDTTVTFKGAGSGGSGPNSYVRPNQPNAWAGQFSQDGMPADNFDTNGMVQNDSPAVKTTKTKSSGFKTPYQKSDYSYKKFDYKNIKKDVTNVPTEIPKETPIEVPIQIPDDIEIINMPETENERQDYGEYIPYYEMQNDAPVEINRQYVSKVDVNKSKGPYQTSDFSYKKIDYKTINKDKIVKSKDKSIEVSTEGPVSGSSVKHIDIEVVKRPEVRVPSNNMNVDEIKTDETEEVRDIDSMEVFKILQVNKDNHELRVVPMLRLSMPKQKFTIYDYIINTLGEDDKRDSQEEVEKEKKKAKGDKNISYVHITE